MCFSAEASFGLSALLLPAGYYCVQSAFRKNRILIPTAIIPLIFGIQQLFEGLVWRGFAGNDADLIRMSSLSFLFFAVAFWPFWIPFIAIIREPSKSRKRALATVSVIGLIGGLAAYLPLAFDPTIIIADVADHSVHYNISKSPIFDVVPMGLWQLCYIAAVAAPLFLSTRWYFISIGVGLVLSALVAHIVFWYTFASVWCFFAAVLSLCLCWHFKNVPDYSRDSPNLVA